MGNCNAAEWDGKAMPRPPSRDRQILEPMAAFQMVHIMEGVIQRGTATVLRDLNRPMFGKTGTTSGPTNVWFVGGTPDVVGGVYLGYDQPRPMGGMAHRADASPRRSSSNSPRSLSRTCRRCHSSRRTAFAGCGSIALRAPVFGSFPVERGSQVGGHLGGVPAADRAAPRFRRSHGSGADGQEELRTRIIPIRSPARSSARKW